MFRQVWSLLHHRRQWRLRLPTSQSLGQVWMVQWNHRRYQPRPHSSQRRRQKSGSDSIAEWTGSDSRKKETVSAEPQVERIQLQFEHSGDDKRSWIKQKTSRVSEIHFAANVVFGMVIFVREQLDWWKDDKVNFPSECEGLRARVVRDHAVILQARDQNYKFERGGPIEYRVAFGYQ